MKMDDEREPEAGRDDGTGGDPAAGNHDGQESAAERHCYAPRRRRREKRFRCRRSTRRRSRYRAELFPEEAREAPDNGNAPQVPTKPPEPYIVFDHVRNPSATCTYWTM